MNKESEIKDHLEIDIILLGTYASGKTTVLKLLTEGYTPNMYDLPRVTGTEITKTQMEGFKIKVREMSWNLVKSWPSVYKESKIMIFMVDGTDEAAFASAYIELLSILKNFPRPIALLYNKCDIVDSHRTFYETFRLNELQENYPGLMILPFSAFVDIDIGLLKDWLESIFEIFGLKNSAEGKRRGVCNWLNCFSNKKKTQVHQYRNQDEDSHITRSMKKNEPMIIRSKPSIKDSASRHQSNYLNLNKSKGERGENAQKLLN